MNKQRPTSMCIIRNKVFDTMRHFEGARPLILPRSTIWDNGSEIKIAFLSGKPKMKDHVKEVAAEWLQYANLHFTYVKKTEQSDVRITFNSKLDSFSAVGTECQDYGPHEATMNFGLLDEDPSASWLRGVILHEYGHMIGCGHEHESPKNGGIPWDKEKAFKKYMRDFGWTQQEVEEQIFSKYSQDMIRGSALDRESIMMYPVSETITVGDFRVGWNTQLSQGDKEYIQKVYPFVG